MTLEMKRFALPRIGSLPALGGAVAAVAAVVACTSTHDTSNEGAPGALDPSLRDGGALERDGSTYDSTPSPEAGLGELLFRPDHLYTGSDGTHTFRAPIAVYDADPDLLVTIDDPAGLSIADAALAAATDEQGTTDNGRYFMLTARKPGSYTLIATSKGRSAKASVTVTAYEPDRHARGETRYAADGVGADRPCTSCHADKLGIDHSPAALAMVTDQDVGVVITTGILNGSSGPSVITISSEPGTLHKWNVTDAEKAGLITYLRALPPRGFR